MWMLNNSHPTRYSHREWHPFQLFKPKKKKLFSSLNVSFLYVTVNLSGGKEKKKKNLSVILIYSEFNLLLLPSDPPISFCTLPSQFCGGLKEKDVPPYSRAFCSLCRPCLRFELSVASVRTPACGHASLPQGWQTLISLEPWTPK
jgi:hypothetical protein